MKIGLNIIGDIDPAADIGKVFRFFHRVDAQEIIGGNIEADGQIIEIIVSADDIALVVRRDAEAVSVWNIERETGEIVGKIDGSIAVIQCAEADSEFFEDIGQGFSLLYALENTVRHGVGDERAHHRIRGFQF